MDALSLCQSAALWQMVMLRLRPDDADCLAVSGRDAAHELLGVRREARRVRIDVDGDGLAEAVLCWTDVEAPQKAGEDDCSNQEGIISMEASYGDACGGSSLKRDRSAMYMPGQLQCVGSISVQVGPSASLVRKLTCASRTQSQSGLSRLAGLQ